MNYCFISLFEYFGPHSFSTARTKSESKILGLISETELFPSWGQTSELFFYQSVTDLMVSKGDNMPIAGLIPLIVFFTYLSLSEAFRHDRLIKQGRRDEVLDEMYK